MNGIFFFATNFFDPLAALRVNWIEGARLCFFFAYDKALEIVASCLAVLQCMAYHHQY